jgi:hypothetical protein
MKTQSLRVLLPLLLLLISCQPADPANRVMGGNLQGTQSVVPAYHAPVSGALRDHVAEQEDKRFKSNLISFSRFIYLEEAKITLSDLRHYDDVSADYGLDSSVTRVYDIGHHPIEIKYDAVLGHGINVFTNDHRQYKARVKSAVLIYDPLQQKAYYAGVVDVPKEPGSYGAWVSHNNRLNPFPFIEEQNPQASDLALVYFDSLAEFHVLKKEVEALKEYQYDVTETRIFNGRKGEKYVLIQHNWIGECEKLLHNYSALYHVTGSGWVLQTEGQLENLFVDMIDIDGDFYPEFLMGDFRSSAIYEITHKGFDKKKELVWNIMACPC